MGPGERVVHALAPARPRFRHRRVLWQRSLDDDLRVDPSLVVWNLGALGGALFVPGPRGWGVVGADAVRGRVVVEVLGIAERRRARERRVRVEQRWHPRGDRSLGSGDRARHGAFLLARERHRDVRARRAYRLIRGLRWKHTWRKGTGSGGWVRGGRSGRGLEIVSRLRIIESGLRASCG